MLGRLASARTGGMLALAAPLAFLPLVFANNYHYEVAILVGLNAIIAVGLNLLIGYAGQISLGPAGFFGVGAYGSANLPPRVGRGGGRAARRRDRAHGGARLRGRPPDPAPERPLPRDGDARPGSHRLDRHRHRGPPHRRPRRDGRAAARRLPRPPPP